jgi:beta-glucosidase
LKAIAATGKPVVVVLIHGGPLAAEWTYANMPTILDAHYPGELGGDAVTAILFGDASPSGRLTTTVYPADFIAQRPMTDMQVCDPKYKRL